MPSKPKLSPEQVEHKANTATDTFIGKLLPDWLKQASPEQISSLRTRFKLHRDIQKRLQEATASFKPLQNFAKTQFQNLLDKRLDERVKIDSLEWLEVRLKQSERPVGISPEIGAFPGSNLEVKYVRQPALLRLMQNFHPQADFFEGTGLVASGEQQLLYSAIDTLVEDCRSADAGASYQHLIDQVFTEATQALLIESKQDGLRLVCEIAALKGQITASELAALNQIAAVGNTPNEQELLGQPGLLNVLGVSVADAMFVQLRSADGESQGVMLYLPSDPQSPLRRFADFNELNSAMAEQLKDSDYQLYFSQLISLQERGAFLDTLGKRLSDAKPDLEMDGSTTAGKVFADLVAQQLQRIKDDARVLLVPTTDADRSATEQRLEAWKGLGWGLLNLAGLFIPTVGAALLGQLVIQTLSQVYEGAEDWYLDHQHEALEHMLNVAETLATVAAVSAGASVVARTFDSSPFVEKLEPISIEGQRERLWSADLVAYEATPEDATLRADGLWGKDDRRWLRVQGRYYEVHRPQEYGPWRLRHPLRENTFEPVVEYNGERAWRLRLERPLEWDDSVRMLECLWPQDPPLDALRAAQIMRVAGVDQDELRGVLVENRPVPFNLRHTLLRFEADARIERYFSVVSVGADVDADSEIQRWCRAQPGMQGLDAHAFRDRLLERESALRELLFKHLTQVPRPDDKLLQLVQRDFPGLPDAYAQEVLRDVSEAHRKLAEVEARIPLALATRARSMLQSARLNRALEGLFLSSAYSDETGELVLNTLDRLPHWPKAVNLELRQGSESGRLLAVIDPQGSSDSRTVLVHKDGQFRVYDSKGHEHDVEVSEPAGIFEAIIAMLSPDQLTHLGCVGPEPAEQLRQLLVQHIPATHKDLIARLGWRAQAPWFKPGHRLADGRLGYLLNGRGQWGRPAWEMLRDRVRSLYWSFNEAQVTAYLERLMQAPGSPVEHVLAQERNYEQMDRVLNRWVSADLSQRGTLVREALAGQMRRSWQMQGEVALGLDGQAEGRSLDLGTFRPGTLPNIPPDTDFGHVTVLVLSNMDIDAVPENFLRAFRSLRSLNLNNNRLLRLPPSIQHLTDLRALGLAHNRIRMDQTGIDVLAGLSRLTHLDLSYNPLGALNLRFNFVPRLAELRLRHCRLRAWPGGIEHCGLLEYADLRENQITTVPREALRMPTAYRMAFALDQNPLAVADREGLALGRGHDPMHGQPATVLQASPRSPRELWLRAGGPPERLQRWNAVSAMPDSDGLFQLLGELQGTSDFQSAHADLEESVWMMLAAVARDSMLRTQIFDRANEARTCGDSIAGRFSELQVQVLVAEAKSAGVDDATRSNLISLGRRLFRLDRVNLVVAQEIARREIEQRGVDEVEVSLGYRVGLAEALNLPFQPRSMLYGTIANISTDQLEAAKEAVRAAETDEALVESLSQREFWRNYLELRHKDAFASFKGDIDERIGKLLETEGCKTDQQCIDEWDGLATERETLLQSLIVQLTQDALEAEKVKNS